MDVIPLVAQNKQDELSVHTQLSNLYLEMDTIYKAHYVRPDKDVFTYYSQMAIIYNKISVYATDAQIKFPQMKNDIITMIENLPRDLCSFNTPPSLDMMFRSDGHAFSKLFNALKKTNLQPFSLDVTKTFAKLGSVFSKTHEMQGISTLYFCSDEFTGLFPHSGQHLNKYTSEHIFGGKRDKLNSLIGATFSTNFDDQMQKCLPTNEFEVYRTSCITRKSFPTFDSRIFFVDENIIGQMFLSRIFSCYRNAVSEIHDRFFGTKAGYGLNNKEKKLRMIELHGFDFDRDCPSCLKFGTFIKNGIAYAILEIPKDIPKFIEWLYAKDIDILDSPFELMLLDDVFKLYPNGKYLSQETLDKEKTRLEELIANKKPKLIKEHLIKIIPKEEVIKLRKERKLKLKNN